MPQEQQGEDEAGDSGDTFVPDVLGEWRFANWYNCLSLFCGWHDCILANLDVYELRSRHFHNNLQE